MSRVKTTYKRFKFDFYPTPPSCVSAIYSHIDSKYHRVFTPARNKKLTVLDAGAGTGVWGTVLKKQFPSVPIQLWGIDIQQVPKPREYDYWIEGIDFLTELGNGPTSLTVTEENPIDTAPFSSNKYDLIVSNPPFKHAEEFLRKSLHLTKRGGHVIMLVRLAFLESIKRGTGLFQEYPPLEVAVLSRRPSFHLDRKTGSLAYMAGLWKNTDIDETRLDWLNWDYEDRWNIVRKNARKHLEKLGVLNEHLESKK